MVRRAQRGVLLLIVLALLAMFGMMAVSFVLLSSQARRAAELSEMRAQMPNTWQSEMDQVMHIVLRGDSNPMEPLWPHSLLESLYGNNATTPAAVTSVSTAFGAQIVGITAAVTSPERRVGTVLTMLTGQAANQSFRIVGYDSTNGLHVLSNGAAIQSGDYFFINGVPFSGMGTGFDPIMATPGASLSLKDFDGTYFALRPMPVAPSQQSPNLDFLSYATDPTKFFGPNVDYVAPDVQHMFLAMQLPDGLAMSTPPNLAPGTVVIPSYHRPELVRYWANSLWLNNPSNTHKTPLDFSQPASLGQYVRNMIASSGSSPSQLSLLRKIVLRPLPSDHPAFTGSNLKFDSSQKVYDSGFNPLWNPADGVGNNVFSWDIDNDGDGIPDAVWLDLGLPAGAPIPTAGSSSPCSRSRASIWTAGSTSMRTATLLRPSRPSRTPQTRMVRPPTSPDP